MHTYANYRNLQLSKYIISIPALAVFVVMLLFLRIVCFLDLFSNQKYACV